LEGSLRWSRVNRAISYIASLLLLLLALPSLVGVINAWGGRVDYKPEFSGLTVLFGLFFLYLAIYNLRLEHPRIPWFGTPSLAQGCAFSWVGFVVVGTVFALIGALFGRRPLDQALLLTLWIGFLGVPFGLAWIVRWIRERGRPQRTR